MPVTLEDLDRLFAKLEKKAPKAGPKPTPKAAPKPTPKYWIPEAVVLWESQWQCRCGCHGPATPELFVRERQGRATRLRAISNPGQYGLLPRVQEQAAPSQVRVCPHCFGGEAEYTAQQLTLPFPEEHALFKQRVQEAVNLADEIDRLMGALGDASEPRLPKRVISRETPLPPSYEFIPRDDVWFEGTDHPRVYHYSISGPFGPELPHCWREE